jgi:Arc/MetJ family transcription regulator
MRTTIDINPELLEKVVAITGEKTKGRAIDRAMEELVRRDAIERLLAARGMFPDMKDRTEEWEEEELRLEEEHRKDRGW